MYLRSAGAVPPVSILLIPEADSGENDFDVEKSGRWRSNDDLRTTWAGILRKEDIFALCVAAVGHDVGHPGFNNMFMVCLPICINMLLQYSLCCRKMPKHLCLKFTITNLR